MEQCVLNVGMVYLVLEQPNHDVIRPPQSTMAYKDAYGIHVHTIPFLICNL